MQHGARGFTSSVARLGPESDEIGEVAAAEAHRSTIAIESRVGEGTRVAVTLSAASGGRRRALRSAQVDPWSAAHSPHRVRARTPARKRSSGDPCSPHERRGCARNSNQAAVLRYAEPMPVGKTPVFDEAAWPFVVVRWPPSTLTDTDFTATLARIASYLERGEPVGLVMDLREAPRLNAERRRQTRRTHR